MAEPLKNNFGAEVPRRLAADIKAVWPAFGEQEFMRDALAGYAELDLMARGRQIARALHTHLPQEYAEAISILLATLGPRLEGVDGFGMAPFFYLPHVMFVAQFGLDDFASSMRAQYELTQRFTAEFSIRPFLERYPEQTLAQLHKWANDPSEHVRRLVSEGTRPRLPWAQQLRGFRHDPRPVLHLLERLKDDPSLYVRRSVANNLNDIGKDHPDLLAETTRRWLADASPAREWIVRHALRSAVKRGDAAALAVLGYGKAARVSLKKSRIAPDRVPRGGTVQMSFEIHNDLSRAQHLLVDLRIHYVKANGKSSPKVFKLKSLELPPHQSTPFGKTLSLTDLTTRKHYVGSHRVEVVINGRAMGIGEFDLLE